jgi:PKD repeat protein
MSHIWHAGSHLRRGRWLRPLVLTLLFGGAGLLGGLYPLLSRHPSAVLACGLGNGPTMLADNTPALLHPVTPNMPPDTPIGVFAPNFFAGQSIAFDEDLSRVTGAPPKNTFQWRWDFGDGTTNNAISPKHSYGAAGTYNVASYILSDGTWTLFDSAQIDVASSALPNPPVAKITASGTAVAQSGALTFDATGSHAVVGSSLTYLWNFNDGGTATGVHVSHTFTIQGKGFVALIVTDSRGAKTVATSNIVVVPELPTAKIAPSATTLAVGEQVTFDASGSAAPATPPNDALTQYIWNFGDGTPAFSTTDPTATHSYAKPGAFTVTLQAFDQQGAYGTTTLLVTVVAIGASSGGPPWLLLGGGTVALVGALAGGFLAIQAQRRRVALIHQRALEMQLARARHVRPGYPPSGRRPGPPQPPRRGGQSGARSGGQRGYDERGRDPRR